MLILISGTNSSGKSKTAENKLSEFKTPQKFYVATAKIFDDEMKARVEKHKAMRAGKNFITIESEKNLADLNFPENSSVLIESLTTWLANEIFDFQETQNPENFEIKIFNEIQILKSKCENLILVADDIFSDGITYDEATEFYRKILASLLIKTAGIADEVIECSAGFAWCYNH